MQWKNNHARYGMLSIAMHWLMLLLLAAVYVCIELREFYPRGSNLREALKTWHFMLGITVLLCVWLRLLFRLGGTQPAITPQPPRWQIHASKILHLALYLFMIAMPLAGWLILSAEGKPIPFFGLQLPALLTENHELAETLEELHESVGTAGYYLIGLHAAAALFHHYILRDNTLLRMLPRK